MKLNFFLIFLLGCGQETTGLISPAGTNSGEPHLSLTYEGQPLLSWLETDQQQTTLKFSVLNNNQWASPKIVAQGDDWFVNWADFPSVEAFAQDEYVAHWLVKKPGNAYSYDIAVSQSADQGSSWSPSQSPHHDGVAAEHGFVTLYHWQQATHTSMQTEVLWLDGRNPKTGTALRSTILLKPGAAHSEETVVDSLVCDCCQTDVVVTEGGPVAVYRNRTTEEIRDIYVTRKLTTGWSTPQPVARDNWNIAGCPVNGPAIAALGERVAVAWYTEAHKEPKVQIALSIDSGANFQAPVLVSSDNPIGRVDIVYTTKGELAIIWMEATGSVAKLSLRTYSAKDGMGPVRVIAETSAQRPSGFPQMVPTGNNSLLIAWTDVTQISQQVLTRLINL